MGRRKSIYGQSEMANRVFINVRVSESHWFTLPLGLQMTL